MERFRGMNPLKKTIKKLLIANQEVKYKSILESKRMDYCKWINQIENAEKDNNLNFQTNEKILKINFSEEVNESENIENDSELAENDNLCKLIEAFYEEKASENEENCKRILLSNREKLTQTHNYLKKTSEKIDFVIFTSYEGEIPKFGFEKIFKEIKNNKNLILLYGDEDVIKKDGTRSNPWFKPDWAPEDFLSCFYMGGFVLLNAKELAKMSVSQDDDLYRLVYKLLVVNGLFDKHSSIESKDDIFNHKVVHIPYILFHSKEKEGYEQVKNLKLDSVFAEKKEEAFVSIIIPSKDHPDILFRCIDSFLDITVFDSVKCEFIVVDNGSSDANKSIIQQLANDYKAKKMVDDFKYIYEKKDFNFSYMCNLGAKNAKGDFLLFLNDDMEVVEPLWLEKLCEKVRLPYAGAVGAKLIYPKSIKKEGDIIQHAGITNLRIGPAHKLQFLSDSKDWYYGRNRGCHDMMGVTGACLLVKRSVFNEAGCFDENLAVAFNDVDLCYSIYEKGYYNIERNDVTLLHHESLSRGDDAASSEKMLRLSREKDYLYLKHQELYGIDPFYNVNLTTDMLEQEYAPRYHYEVHLDERWANVNNMTDKLKSAREDKCLRVGMESAMDIYKWKYGVSSDCGKLSPTEDDMGFYFQGYSFVTGSNNACFEKTLLLRNISTSETFGVELQIEYRPDIKNNLSDQLNVDLTGYTAKIRKDSIPFGKYQFGMYAKDKTSSLRLYNWSNWTLENLES